MRRWWWVALTGAVASVSCHVALGPSGEDGALLADGALLPGGARSPQQRAVFRQSLRLTAGEAAASVAGEEAGVPAAVWGWEGIRTSAGDGTDDRWASDLRDRRAPIVTPDVFYVPSPQPVVDRMLELAHIRDGDVVYDLGCGDGRIVVTAAERYGVRARGYDIDPERVAQAQENVRRRGLGELVTIEQKDMFTLDLSQADVVALYLLPEVNERLIPQLKQMRPGAVVVSHAYPIGAIEPTKVVQVPVGEKTHVVYLWYAPLSEERQ